MTSIVTMHNKFVCDLVDASKLFPHNVFSVIPSVLFLVSMFTLLFAQFHKYTNEFTSWKSRIGRDLIFHWTYFYTTRLWFIFLKVCRWMMVYSDRAIEKTSRGLEAYYNKLLTHCGVLALVLIIALVPCVIVYLKYFYRHEIPNFLMWVGEDPWIRSEMGTSGHYLERPPRADIYSPQKHNLSFRSGRSSSVDTNVYLSKPSPFLRPCKSAVSVKKSSEEIAD